VKKRVKREGEKGLAVETFSHREGSKWMIGL